MKSGHDAVMTTVNKLAVTSVEKGTGRVGSGLAGYAGDVNVTTRAAYMARTKSGNPAKMCVCEVYLPETRHDGKTVGVPVHSGHFCVLKGGSAATATGKTPVRFESGCLLPVSGIAGVLRRGRRRGGQLATPTATHPWSLHVIPDCTSPGTTGLPAALPASPRFAVT